MLSIKELNNFYNTEQVLLVLVCRLYFDTARQQEVQNFIESKEINWDFFYKIIRAHAVRPFVYHLIQTFKLKTDPDFERQLKQDLIPLNIRILHQKAWLDQLLQGLNDIGIKAIPYKGVTFGNAYYKSAALRESSDVDLLVRKTDVKNISDYFKAQNFSPKGEEIPEEYLSYHIATGKDIGFKTPDQRSGIKCSVEIQWRLLYTYMGKYPDYDFFIDHLQEVEIQGRKQLQLEPSYDFLCLISHHFIKDSLTRFKFLVDAACILSVKGTEMDAEMILNTMRRFGHYKLFKASISTINDLLGVYIPEFETENIFENSLIRAVVKFPVIHKVQDLKQFKVFISLQDTRWHQLKAWLRLRALLMPTVRDIKEVKLPAYLLPVFFMTRPFRLAYKYLLK